MKTIKLSSPRDLHLFLGDFYESIAYDGSPEFKDYVPRGIWLSLYEGKELVGFINLEPLNNVMWNCHVMIYPHYRGNKSEEWGVRTAKYMRDIHSATKFLAITPYESAKKYAERVGFKCIGMLSRSIQKDDELMDQYILEMSV